MTNNKVVLLIKEAGGMLNNDEMDEMIVHVHQQLEIDGKIYVPVVQDDITTICRVDYVNGEQIITDNLTDEEYQRVQICFNSTILPHV